MRVQFLTVVQSMSENFNKKRQNAHVEEFFVGNEWIRELSVECFELLSKTFWNVPYFFIEFVIYPQQMVRYLFTVRTGACVTHNTWDCNDFPSCQNKFQNFRNPGQNWLKHFPLVHINLSNEALSILSERFANFISHFERCSSCGVIFNISLFKRRFYRQAYICRMQIRLQY